MERTAERERRWFERAPDAVLVLADDVVADANDAAAALFGADVVGRTATSLFAHDSAILAAIADARTGIVRKLRGEITITRDGEGRRFEYALRTCDDREHVFVGRDVTERSRRDEMWERYQLLSETAHDIVLFIRRDGRILEANEAAAHAYGYTRDELRRLTVQDLRAPATRDGVTAQMQDAFARGVIFETLHMRRDGTTFPVEVSSRSSVIGDEPVLLSIIRDLTERQALQARLVHADRMAAVGTIAAGVAHEINNPLAYALTNLEVLHRSLHKIRRRIDEHPELSDVLAELESATQMLDTAREGADRVRAIVRDLKTFSRVDDLQHGPLDVRIVLDSCINMAAAELRHRARLVRDYRDVPPVDANESRLAQVFLNLLVNAAHAFPEARSDASEIVVVTRTDEQGRAVVEIADNGAGIPDELRDRIFDPFVTTKPAGEGTGLGLFISRDIVTAAGGSIDVESAFGRGTRMTVTLPAAALSAGSSAPPKRHLARPPRVGRLLVVDDEDSIGVSVRRALEGDFNVVIATSGREALALLDADREFDVILCDVVMPDLDGVGVYEAARALDPRLADRFVFMSGGLLASEARAFLGGLQGRLVDKPFAVDELRTVLRRRIP